MDIQTITSLIGSVGFPIVACGALWYSMQQQDKRHQEEMEKLRETVENNTKAVLELSFLIKKEADDHGKADQD